MQGLEGSQTPSEFQTAQLDGTNGSKYPQLTLGDRPLSAIGW
ncbi:hypothetical protein AEP_01673 [Curvibacter sp. AEP1-3]|nr:hypothetical protein AEP_01673 [Curvibacter sp. AEP1-3]